MTDEYLMDSETEKELRAIDRENDFITWLADHCPAGGPHRIVIRFGNRLCGKCGLRDTYIREAKA